MSKPDIRQLGDPVEQHRQRVERAAQAQRLRQRRAMAGPHQQTRLLLAGQILGGLLAGRQERGTLRASLRDLLVFDALLLADELIDAASTTPQEFGSAEETRVPDEDWMPGAGDRRF